MFRLHHINLSSSVVPQMDVFYRTVLGLGQSEDGAALNRLSVPGGYSAPVSFFKSADIEIHVATRDLDLNFRLNQAVNPLVNGHIAFRTDDINAVKRHLDAKGVKYSDYGVWSINNWHQIFFLDPAGNVVEVHQVV